MKDKLDSMVDDRVKDGVFRVQRAAFSDPHIFDLEMKYIFARTWVCVGVEAQIPQPHDFITSWIGNTSVLVTRDADGQVGVFTNVCPHKGAMLVSRESGNRRAHVCQYHGWTYDSAGRNTHIKKKAEGGYAPAFDDDSHNLQPVPRVAVYRGFIFAALTTDVPSLDDYLGDVRTFLDLVVDQSPQGIEVIPGRVVYTYRGNWKAQMDNTCDGYHLTSTHASFMDVLRKRSRGEGNVTANQYDWERRLKQEMGVVAFPNGHGLTWMDQAEPEKRPIFPVIDEIRARVGDIRTDWMIRGRAITVFPNVQLADLTSLNIRFFRPLGPGLTEMRILCLAPVGESRERRSWRLRQFEDFFNPSGIATPDDTAMYELSHQGSRIEPQTYLQCYARGMTTRLAGDHPPLDVLGVKAEHAQMGGFDASFETAMHSHYREWKRLLQQGLQQEEDHA